MNHTLHKQQAEYRSQIMLFEERKRRKLQELSRLAEEQEAYVARMDEVSGTDKGWGAGDCLKEHAI